MSDFQPVVGFEDLWRPPGVRPRFSGVTVKPKAPTATRARLARIAHRAPEVVVSVTGRTHAGRQLRAHLDYVSRKGDLALEGVDGQKIAGREEVQALADEWIWSAAVDSHRTPVSVLSRSMVLSMPSGVDGVRMEAAARAFCAEAFRDTFDYVFVRHADAPNPHLHLAIRAQGANGERFNPMKADLATWRETFAEALRDQGVEAEATPRRARGVTLKAERPRLRRLRLLYEQGEGPMPDILQRAHREADSMLSREARADSPWEASIRKERRKVIGIYLAAAEELNRSPDPEDRELSQKLTTLVRDMPPPLTRMALLAQEKQAWGLIETIEREREDRLASQDRGRAR